jgi:2-hydroxy-3-keto-5-methylthiopentenyl-1-phosphate phosphatase
MRNSVAKRLKKEVAIALYSGDDVSEQDVMDDRKTVFASDDFKSVYRARKKNYNRHETVVKNIIKDETPDVIINNMMTVRKRADDYRKHQIKQRRRK